MIRLRLFAAICALLLSSMELARANSQTQGVRSRVRRELRSLTPREYRLLVTGLSTMLAVPTAEGQAIYGRHYKSYDYFIVKHAVSVNDPRGDQGHFGSCFMTFHRAWLLEFELSLLSVVPELRALPYWDITLDSRQGGRYFNTPNYIFSAKWAGSIDPSADENYAVKDGIFAWRQVQKFNWAVYREYASIYNGSLTNGLLRSPTSTQNSTYVTRFPTANLFKQNASMSIGDATIPIPPDFEWDYSPSDYIKCTDATAYRNWTAWGYCVDISTVPKQLLAQYIPPASSALLHTGVHWAVGSLSDSGQMGDMFDVGTSPNEVLLFFAHHANVDRNNMIWQANLARRNPAMVTPQAMYGFPASASEYPFDVTGCYLNDVVNSNFKFTDIFGTTNTKPSGYTHYEVLQNTRPFVNSPYLYDTMTRL